MRILLANQIGAFGNHGDDGLMDVALTRLRRAWPDTVFQIVAYAPAELVARYPDAQPIPLESFRAWRDFHHRTFIGRLHRYMPATVSRRVLALERVIQRSRPAAEDMRQFHEALLGADLVLVTGGGHFMKGHETHGIRLLQVLRAARANGTPTAMVSQGILPIEHPELSALMKAVLPTVGLITLREGRDAIPFLEACGARDNFVVTGDDLIELAHRARVTELGTGIGVCLRVAVYSEVDPPALAAVRAALLRAARRYGASLYPVPISSIPGESDVVTMQKLLAGTDAADGGHDIDTPLKAIRQVGRCRLVVAGSYHAGVFALSQGIPVVGLARSAYYVHKFNGLADQFGTGCQVVLMDDPRFPEALVAAIEAAWRSAQRVRRPLLEAAARQIEAAHTAYKRVYELVRSSSGAPAAAPAVAP
jgi:colanic acid/amylovoran biosynthesis protein